MVGTARAADLAVFIKKVGYSVGLESLQKRAFDFAKAYAGNPSLRMTTWSDLVHKKWKLKSDHVSDVFAAFEIVRISNQEPIAGHIGEALGICARQMSDDILVEAVRYLVALTVIQHDGDIFLNGLQASFQKGRFVQLLMDALTWKRELLFRLFSGYPEREAIVNAIRIDRQRTNVGGAAARRGLVASHDGRPLSARIDSLQLGLPKRADLGRFDAPSDDYVEKVLVTRKGWAESLGLYGATGITAAGTAFLTSLASNGYGSHAGFMYVWPTRFEVEKARFDPSNFGDLGLRDTAELHRDILRAISDDNGKTNQAAEEAAKFVTKVFDDFQALAVNRAMIRNELPIAVLSSVAAATAHATGFFADFESLRKAESAGPSDISWRPSLAIEAAITVRRR
jgi:hypothetical protein